MINIVESWKILLNGGEEVAELILPVLTCREDNLRSNSKHLSCETVLAGLPWMADLHAKRLAGMAEQKQVAVKAEDYSPTLGRLTSECKESLYASDKAVSQHV